MTNHEQFQPLPMPDFMQSFTGDQPEVPPERQQLIARHFADLTRNLLLNNIESIVTRQSSQGETARNQIELIRPDRGGAWLIKVMEQTDATSDPAMDKALQMPQAAIEIEFLDSNQQERHGYQYRLRDGIVSRIDFDDLATEPGEDEYELDEDAARAARRYDQPIDDPEGAGLEAFVTSAQPLQPPVDQ